LLYHNLPAAAFLQLSYRNDTGLLTGRWLRSVTDEELQQGYESLRIAARYHDCRYWLIDARRRISRNLNGPEWVLTEFMPQLQQECGGHWHLAFLVLPDYLRTLQAEPGSPAATSLPEAAIHYARFVNEGEANAWLLGCQRVGG
jgi:hypothetical protein